jgi:2-oxo-4-hydroxy-4-carboxy--5-ureidoimidazoline (OHCU) decarboxylase
VRELPRKLSVDELAELFEGPTRLVELLADRDDPLGEQAVEDVLVTICHEDKVAALNAHPAIGQRAGLSARSASEQGSDADPAVLDELERLNAAYEDRFGFRFVVFVNRRSKAEILEVLRERIENTPEEELDTSCRELVAIARDRWTRT